MPLRLISWGIAVLQFPTLCSCTVEQLEDSIGGGGGRAWATPLSEEMIWQSRYVSDSFVGTAEKRKNRSGQQQEESDQPTAGGRNSLYQGYWKRIAEQAIDIEQSCAGVLDGN